MRQLRIGLAQVNVTVGDIEGNTRRVLDEIERARALGVDLVAFPELCLTGYPPEDLLFRPAFIEANFRALDRVARASTGLIVVVGFVYYFVPNAKVRFRDVWIGAIATGLMWKGALEGFSWYIRDMSRFTRVNGSVAAVVVFLVWVYVQAVILLYGVEFTAAYARLRHAG